MWIFFIVSVAAAAWKVERETTATESVAQGESLIRRFAKKSILFATQLHSDSLEVGTFNVVVSAGNNPLATFNRNQRQM